MWNNVHVTSVDPPFVTEHGFLTICFGSCQATGPETLRQSPIWLANPLLSPPFCCYGWSFFWCNTNTVAIATVYPPPNTHPPPSSYSIISSPSLFFVLTLPHWFLFVSLSSLHLLSPLSIFAQCSHFPCILLFFFSFFVFLFCQPLPCLFTSPLLGWPIFQQAVQLEAAKTYLQSAVGPQFVGQWDRLRNSLYPRSCVAVPSSHMSEAHEDTLKPFSWDFQIWCNSNVAFIGLLWKTVSKSQNLWPCFIVSLVSSVYEN